MASVTFVLKENKSPTSIILLFRYDNKRVKIYTKQTVDPKFWDKNKRRVRNSIKTDSAVNGTLNEMENLILELFDRITQEFGRKPEPKELKNLFELEYFESKPQFSKKKHKSLLEVFDEYEKRMLAENKPKSAEKYSEVKKGLIEFGKQYKYEIQFETINENFRNDFIEYMRTEKLYAETTIHRKLKFVKTIINYAIDCKYIREMNINLKRFVTPYTEADTISLTQSELEEIENLDLSKSPKLDRVRDRFLLGCYTGLRFSDFIRINKNHIEDGKYLVIKQKKTDKVITQPFWDSVKRIFEKYEYNLPRPISESNFNSYLKEVTKLCETLKREQEVKQNIKGKVVRLTKPRHSLVTSHTARRTFSTLKAESGWDLEDISTATGHASIKTLRTYIKLNDKQKADRLAKIHNSMEEKKQSQNKEAKIVQMKVSN